MVGWSLYFVWPFYIAQPLKDIIGDEWVFPSLLQCFFFVMLFFLSFVKSFFNMFFLRLHLGELQDLLILSSLVCTQAVISLLVNA